MMETRSAKSCDRLIFLLALASFLSVLLLPEVAGEGMRSGLLLCCRAVIPSVFPSLVLTDLLLSFDTTAIERTVGRVFSRLFRVSERGAVAWIAGLLAGFPVGAITVASDVRAGRLSKEEGEYLLSFVNNTGPAFLVGGVGAALFGSVKLGWALYLLQIPVSVTVGLLFRPRRRYKVNREIPAPRRATDLIAAVVSASENCVRIAGFVCFFSVLSALLARLLPDGLLTALISVILEIGNGAKAAAGLSFPFPALPIVAFSVCFSGLSVVCQSLAVISGSGMRASRFFTGKIAAGTVGFLLSLLLCLTK